MVVGLRAAALGSLLVACACNALFGVDDYRVAAEGVAATGNGGAGTAGGGMSNVGGGGEAGYLYELPLIVTAARAENVPAGYSLQVTLDHSALATADKSTIDGNDVRVFWLGGDAPRELDRVLEQGSGWNSEATSFWIRMQADIPAGTSDTNYLLRYGNPTAGDPPSDPTAVFEFWEPFDQLQSGWQLLEIGLTLAAIDVSGGIARITSTSDDIWNQADNCALLARSVSGNVVAEVLVLQAASEPTAHVGGIMLRQSAAPESRHASVTPYLSLEERAFIRRNQDSNGSQTTTATSDPGLPELYRLTRIGDGVTAEYRKLGGPWQPVGTPDAFGQPLDDPVLVGIPHASAGGFDGWVEIDWFRLRKAVSNHPALTFGQERLVSE
jgi:hypothetical protein